MGLVRRYIKPLLLGTLVLASGLLIAAWFTRAQHAPLPLTAPVTAPTAFDHSVWDELLSIYVDDAGLVDYQTLLENRTPLDTYLSTLAHTDPENLSTADQIAFWINAYNAYTLRLIIDNYPPRSILLVNALPIPRITMPWDLSFATVGGTTYTLNEIEHSILRKRFAEPRIHFALVCASLGCPALRRAAYTGATLAHDLDAETRRFLRDPMKNRATASTLYLSKIFNWFAKDFTQEHGSVKSFIAPYFPPALQNKILDPTYPIVYTDYDWSLNDQHPKKGLGWWAVFFGS